MLSGQTELPYEVLCQRRSYEYREHPLSIEFDLAPSVVGSMIGRVGGVVMFRFVFRSFAAFSGNGGSSAFAIKVSEIGKREH